MLMIVLMGGANIAVAQEPNAPIGGPHPAAEPVVGSITPPVTEDAEPPALQPPGAMAPTSLFYVNSEYLLWRIGARENLPVASLTVPIVLSLPAPVTTGTATLSVTNLAIFPNGDSFDPRDSTGDRFTVGLFLDRANCFSLEGSYLELYRHTVDTAVSIFAPINAQTPLTLTLPTPLVLQLQNGTPPFTQATVSATLAANLTDSARAVFANRLWGSEANFRCRKEVLWCDRLDVLLGFRYLNLDEELRVSTTGALNTLGGGLQFQNPSTATNDVAAIPSLIQFSTFDGISVHNQFYGGQIGFAADWELGHVYFKMIGKLAIGPMHQDVNISNSSQIVSSSGFSSTVGGGLLTQPVDVGHHQRDRLAVVPELNVLLGLRITSFMSLFAGYDFLYLSSVVRPGDQIGAAQLNSQVSLLGAAATSTINAPAFRFSDKEIWIQGLNAGVELRY